MSNYWQQRNIELENLLQSRTLATIIEVNRMYAESTKVIDKKIREIFSTYVKGGHISSDYALELLSAKQTAQERQELLELLNNTNDSKLKRELISILDAPAYADRIERLQALQNRIYIEALSLGIKEERLTKTRLIDTVKQSYYRTIYNSQIKNGFYYNFDNITDKRIKAMLAHNWAKGNYSSRIWNNNDKFVKKLQRTLEVGCMTGMTLNEMMEHITDDCIGSTSDEAQRLNASRLIRTEVNYFANQGILEGYKQAEINEYYFLATLDLRTSEICRKLDMKLFDLEDAEVGVNFPPMHPFCRSVTIPKESAEGGKRAAIDPETGKRIEVPSDMTYQQWYDKYVKNNQKVLAQERSYKYTNSDKEQFEKYKSVLRELSPKTLDDFIDIKYNNSDKWNQLKHQYRTLNQYKIDSGNLTAQEILDLDKNIITEKRNNFTSKYKSSGNIAGVYIDNNKDKIILAHSSINVEKDFSKYKGEYTIIGLTDDRQFNYINVLKDDGKLRFDTFYDTEAKIFEYLAKECEKNPIKEITMLSERGMCDSCLGVMEQFKSKYNVKVNAVSNKKVEGNVWKHRYRKNQKN